MAFEDVMAKVSQWGTEAEALAALGAQLTLLQSGESAPAEVASGVEAVMTAAGLADLDQIPPPQRAMVIGMVRMFLRQALELLDNPTRGPGWSYVDPDILDGYGRGSAMLPAAFSQLHSDLANVTSFLDVGTGVGLLACAAANVWPNAKVVGIDPWDASLERARANVAAANLGDRIELRQTTLGAIDDKDAFDLVWIPSFFLTEDILRDGLATTRRALQVGGWVVVGMSRPSPDPLADAVGSLQWIRGGGSVLDSKTAVGLLESAGYTDVQVANTPPFMPIELVIGRRA